MYLVRRGRIPLLSFDLLLINPSRYLVFRVYFSPCQRNIVCEVFFNVKLILFIKNFYQHIFRSSRFPMFFKISALKNFAMLRIKKRPQCRCFRVRSSHMMLIYIFILDRFFHRTLITSYFCPVNIVKLLRTAFSRTPSEAVVCRCSSK